MQIARFLAIIAFSTIASISSQAQWIEYEGSALFSGGFYRVDVAEGYAYVGAMNSIQILSLEDPLAPRFLSGYPFLTDLHNFCVSGDFAYATDGLPWFPDYFRVIDMSDRSAPELAASIYLPGVPYELVVEGNYAYVAADYGIQVVDISDPYNPSYVNDYETPGAAVGVFARGNYLFVADNYSGLQILDISDPANPSFVGSFQTATDAWGVFADDSLAYIAEGTYDIFTGALEIVDISDPSSPEFVGIYTATGYFGNIQVFGNYAYFTVGSEFVWDYRIVDVSEPSNPTLAGSYDYNYYDLSLTPHYVYGATGSEVHVFETANVSDPVPVGFYEGSGYINRVVAAEDYAYVASGRGLWVVDYSDAASPAVIGSYLEGYALDICISSNYAFLTISSSGLHIVDISQPSDPVFVGSYPAERFTSVSVQGDYAYLTETWEGLFILDVSDPSEPVLAAIYDADGYEKDVFVHDVYAYLAVVSEGQLQVVNVEDPSNPFLEGYSQAPDYPLSVYVADGYAYMADRWQGVKIFNVEDPANPTFAGTYNSPGIAYDAKVFGHCVIVADDSDGIQMVDITDPENPDLVASFDTPGKARDVWMVDDQVLVADGSSLMILRYYPETAIENNNANLPNGFSLAQNYPNPFNTTITIQYDLPEDCHVVVDIYDILGRHVKTLVDAAQPAGSHHMIWDAADRSSGIYFYRILAGEFTDTKKMTLLK